MEKPFKVALVVKQKHGVLWAAIRERGWSQREAADFLGIDQGALGRILNFKGPPPQFKNDPIKERYFKSRLIGLTGKTFEDLFPEEVYNDKVFEKAKPFDFFVDRDIATLKLEASSETSLVIHPSYDRVSNDDIMDTVRSALTEGEMKYVQLRFFEGRTHKEIGKMFGATVEASRQSEVDILKKLRAYKAVLRGDEDIDLNKIVTDDVRALLKESRERNRSGPVRKCVTGKPVQA